MVSYCIDCGWHTHTYRVLIAECALNSAVHFGDLDVSETRKLLAGKILPCWSEVLTVAAPTQQDKKGITSLKLAEKSRKCGSTHLFKFYHDMLRIIQLHKKCSLFMQWSHTYTCVQAEVEPVVCWSWTRKADVEDANNKIVYSLK